MVNTIEGGSWLLCIIVAEREIVQDTNTKVKDVLQKIDLWVIVDWDPKIQQGAHDLICEYVCTFSQNELDFNWKHQSLSIPLNWLTLHHLKNVINAFNLVWMKKWRCIFKKCWMWVLFNPPEVLGLVLWYWYERKMGSEEIECMNN